MGLAGPQRSCNCLGPQPSAQGPRIGIECSPPAQAAIAEILVPATLPLGPTHVWPWRAEGFQGQWPMEPLKFKETNEERSVVQIAF